MTNEQPSKLFKMKMWMTVPEAAKHLSTVFSEDVSEADLLRFALDGHLKLSVYFVNHAEVKFGKVIHYKRADLERVIAAGKLPDELRWSTYGPDLTESIPGVPDGMKGKPVVILRSLQIDDDRYLNLESKVRTIDGIWDLPMVGSEQLDVEHRYQMLTGGPAVELMCLDGAFVEGNQGEICQLQDRFSTKNTDAPKGKTDQDSSGKKKINTPEGKTEIEDRYVPAEGLPGDAVLIVRTNVLQEFMQLVGREEGKDESAKQRRERLMSRVNAVKASGENAFLKVVAAEEGISVSRLKQIIAPRRESANEKTGLSTLFMGACSKSGKPQS